MSKTLSNEQNTLRINELYRTYLERDADDIGLNSYLEMLKNGKTIDDVINTITSSVEYLNKKKQQLTPTPIISKTINIKHGRKHHQTSGKQQRHALITSNPPTSPSSGSGRVPRTSRAKKTIRHSQPTTIKESKKESKIKPIETKKKQEICELKITRPSYDPLSLTKEMKDVADFYMFMAENYKPYDYETAKKKEDKTLSVVITNWRREDKLMRCVEHIIANDIFNIIISCSEVTSKLIEVLKNIILKYSFIRVVITSVDAGCNWCWLSGVYLTTTTHVLIMHDDDLLTPNFKNDYIKKIKPKLDNNEVGHVYWDGLIMDYLKNGEMAITDEYHTNAVGHGAETGLYDPHTFYDIYKSPQSTYPLSPVVQILDAHVARKTLKECECNFMDDVFFYPRKTMLIGNDIMLNLRNLQNCIMTNKKMLYIHNALTYYGRWNESVSQQAIDESNPKLVEGYNATREYYKTHEHITYVDFPVYLHTTSFFCPSRTSETFRRHYHALLTWVYQYDNKQMIHCPYYDSQMKRTSKDVGDRLCMPFIRDIFNNALCRCNQEDVITFCNSDICMTENIIEKSCEQLQKHQCTFSFRRDIYDLKLDYFIPFDKIEEYTKWYVGMDYTAFTKKWWSKHMFLTTDALIGKPTWDWMMRFVFTYSVNPKTAMNTSVYDLGKIVETSNVIYHEKHPSFAERSDIYLKDRANIYNFTTMVYFLLRYFPYDDVFLDRFRRFCPIVELIVKAIYDFGNDVNAVVSNVYDLCNAKN